MQVKKKRAIDASLGEEEVLEDGHGVLRAGDGVADGACVFVDLVVVAASVDVVAEEVDLFKAFRLDVLQAVGLVPALGELCGPMAPSDRTRRGNNGQH